MCQSGNGAETATTGRDPRSLLSGIQQRDLSPAQRKEKGTVLLRQTSCSMQQAPQPAWLGRAVAEPGHKSWDVPKPISIIGSTGSVGTQVKRFKPQLVSVRHESLIGELKEALADAEQKPEIIPGEEGIVEVSCVLHTSQWLDLLSSLHHNVFGYELQVACHPDAVTVVTGIVGCAGLKVKAYRFF
ncbi:hypothetical protein BHE74_00029862 [Ensete ventricosum]|nr:hypothetical protein BHE74_00029862 [Ensete ventricosum]